MMPVTFKWLERKGVPRRTALKAGVLALASAMVKAGPSAARPTPAPAARYGMVIDLRRCTGCRACVVACKAEHGVRLGGFRTWVSEKETGEYPAVSRHFLPALCNHCDDPPCRRVCPTGATYKRDDGIVAIDHDLCIGCRHCMGACPYSARYFNPLHDPEGEAAFPARTHGTVDKCDFCLHRVENGVVPACVNTCPMNARIFGDLNDPGSEVSRLLKDAPGATLLPGLGTGPRVYYVGGDLTLFLGEDAR